MPFHRTEPRIASSAVEFGILILRHTLRLAPLILWLLLAPTATVYAQQILKDLLNPNGAQITIDKDKIKIQPRPVLCQQPFVPRNGRCVCPAGTRPSGNNCLPLLRCPDSFVSDSRGNCVCPQGQIVVNNRCTTLQVRCDPPFVRENNKCVCPPGERRVNNRCLPIVGNILCNAPFVPNANQTRCICPADTRRVGNTCETIVDTPQCAFPFVYSQRQDDCVCARGYELNRRGTRCVRIESAPQIPRSTIREIQRCLSKLGYDAGPADGAIGRRTRTAWNAFRQDNDIRAGANDLSDNSTQNRLFRLCAQSNSNPQPTPSLPPSEEEKPDDGNSMPSSQGLTNFDPVTGYPAVQCASAELIEVLRKELPESELPGLCGEICIPIPEGMTPDQIEATRKSVNWCLNCTQIGSLGLMCSSNPEAGKESDKEKDDSIN